MRTFCAKPRRKALFRQNSVRLALFYGCIGSWRTSILDGALMVHLKLLIAAACLFLVSSTGQCILRRGPTTRAPQYFSWGPTRCDQGKAGKGQNHDRARASAATLKNNGIREGFRLSMKLFGLHLRQSQENRHARGLRRGVVSDTNNYRACKFSIELYCSLTGLGQRLELHCLI